MTKKELRTKYKSLRNQLPEGVVKEMSLTIANKLLQVPVWSRIYFHVFLPITEQKEVDTEPILHLLWGKDKEVVVARSDFNTLKMTHFLMTENTKFKKNSYNISEPLEGLEVPPAKIEVVFVPLLAFDKMGHRVGYGKGFYDAFLAECKTGTIKIGLSLFDAEESIDDVYENDVTLDFCVTPNRLYAF